MEYLQITDIDMTTAIRKIQAEYPEAYVKEKKDNADGTVTIIFTPIAEDSLDNVMPSQSTLPQQTGVYNCGQNYSSFCSQPPPQTIQSRSYYQPQSQTRSQPNVSMLRFGKRDLRTKAGRNQRIKSLTGIGHKRR